MTNIAELSVYEITTEHVSHTFDPDKAIEVIEAAESWVASAIVALLHIGRPTIDRHAEQWDQNLNEYRAKLAILSLGLKPWVRHAGSLSYRQHADPMDVAVLDLAVAVLAESRLAS